MQTNPELEMTTDDHVSATPRLQKINDRNQRGLEHLESRLGAMVRMLESAGWTVAVSPEARGAMATAPQLGNVPPKSQPSGYRGVSDCLPDSGQMTNDAIALMRDGVTIWRNLRDQGSQASLDSPLSSREEEVMGWIINGKTAPEIAIILGCSKRTVEKHIASAYRKRGVRDRGSWILKHRKQCANTDT